jgi:tetrahydromethanopterin S-methyltransferase subunit G
MVGEKIGTDIGLKFALYGFIYVGIWLFRFVFCIGTEF